MTAAKPRSVCLRAHEARRLLEHGRVLLVREVKDELKPWENGEPNTDDPSLFHIESSFEGVVKSREIRCPFGPVGTRLACREAWQQVPREQTRLHDRGYGIWPGTKGRPAIQSINNIHCDIIFRADGEFVSSSGEKEVWRSSTQMPEWCVRLHAENAGVVVKRCRDVTEEEALAMGYDVDECSKVFHAASKRVRWEYARWLRDPRDGSRHDGLYCVDCAKKEARKEKAEVDGWDESFEEDGPRWCDECGVLLCHSMSTYGIESELESDGPRIGGDAAILANLAGGIGDLREEHHGRLAKAAFATAIGPAAWERNAWLWLCDARRVTE